MTDKVLTAMIGRALAGNAQNFVLAIKGTKAALTLSRKKINSGNIKDVKDKLGGSGINGIYQGVCVQGSGKLIFKSIDPPPTKAVAMIRDIVKEETGKAIAPQIEKVDSLVEIDEKDGPEVIGGKSAIDTEIRKIEDVDKAISRISDFLMEYKSKRSQIEAGIVDARNQIDTVNASRVALEEQKRNQSTGAVDLSVDIKKCADVALGFEKTIAECKKQMENLDETKRKYDVYVANYNAAKTDDERFHALLPGSEERMGEVAKAMEDVFTATNKRLMILGRLADTIGTPDSKKEGKTSWLDKNPDETGRVLGDGAWSMAVNDAFVRSGLDQKADVAMLTKFQDEVQSELKRLLKNPNGWPKDKIKQEFRKFVKDHGDAALFKGEHEKNNEGFAIYMIELEQLIDDGYVLMKHDLDGANENLSRDLDYVDRDHTGAVFTCTDHRNVRMISEGECPICYTKLVDESSFVEQVMVPSGTGQKIKKELADAVDARKERAKLGNELLRYKADRQTLAKILADEEASKTFKDVSKALAREDNDAARLAIDRLRTFLE